MSVFINLQVCPSLSPLPVASVQEYSIMHYLLSVYPLWIPIAHLQIGKILCSALSAAHFVMNNFSLQ